MNQDLYKKYASIMSVDNSLKKTNYDELYFKKYYLKKISPNKNIEILEIACGNGKYLEILKKLGYKNTLGIDLSEEQIEIAKKKSLNVKCISAVDFLKQNKKKYDVILLIDIFEHLSLDDSIEVIKLIYDQLNKKGKVFIQVPNALAPFSPHRYSDITHLRSYTTTSLHQTINFSYFKKIAFYELPVFIHGFKSLIRKLLWTVFLKPGISFFLYAVYGTNYSKIYTANFLCVLEK